ncbi:MAG: type III secretion system inner rod subunit SctI [Alteromonadaceae bacterium]|nr:type III secretion system inner rod subunit SctI [Alteromonadaceae bacterium]
MEPVSGISSASFDSFSTSEFTMADNFAENYQDIDSLGNKFFEILSDAKENIATKSVEISEALNVKDISPVDLIRLQFQLAELTIQQELVSKGVSKSTQNVDTLLKAQ